MVIATGFIGALAGGLLETGLAHGGRIEEALMSAASVVVTFAAVTALVVLSSAADLAVSLQARSYALWQLVGIRPSLVGAVVLAQLAIVAVVGASIGCLIAAPLFRPIFDLVFGSWEGNWLAYNDGHDIALPGSSGPKLGFLMYPQGETANGRVDSLDPANFAYSITSRKLA